VLVALACGAPAHGLAAQDVVVTGQVRRDSAAGRPLAGHWVVLHGMTRGGGGPVDSQRTDAAGRYRFLVRQVDSSAIYVVSALYAGIGHFSEPRPLSGRLAAELGSLVVYDTASTGEPVFLALRFLTVGGARTDGAREVLEAVELENRAARTRIAADGGPPVWQGALPAGVVEWHAGESDVSPEAIVRRGDSVAVYAPIAPGGTKQITFAYVVPASVATLRLPVDQPTGELLLLVEDTAAAVTAPGLETLAVEDIEGRRFARYRTGALAAGADVAIVLPSPGARPERFVPWIVGAAALAVLGGLVAALRRRPRPT
jgi:hypothetical protein